MRRDIVQTGGRLARRGRRCRRLRRASRARAGRRSQIVINALAGRVRRRADDVRRHAAVRRRSRCVDQRRERPRRPCRRSSTTRPGDDVARAARIQGTPATAAAPTPLNQVTFTRYRVVYRRTDGRNAPGVDVPFPFDSAVTFTVPRDGPGDRGLRAGAAHGQARGAAAGAAAQRRPASRRSPT